MKGGNKKLYPVSRLVGGGGRVQRVFSAEGTEGI